MELVTNEFDSEGSGAPAPKGRTGIPGFDEISEGGFPHGATTLLIGGAGTGKTVFSLQTLVAGASNDEPGIFIAFEEAVRKVRANALSFGWEVNELERNKKLFFLEARLSAETVWSGKFDLDGMIKTLSAKIAEMGAKRIVFDSIDVLLSLFDNSRAAEHELRRIYEWLAEAKGDLMGIITARSDSPARHPALLYVADCVVCLRSPVTERVTLRTLRILKYRGSSFKQNEFPFSIGPRGVEVGVFGTTPPLQMVSSEHISSGISRLDAMLEGGYFRGSSVLITGTAGTAKTTLAGCFAQATCRRQERVLYVSFDEGVSEIIRNLGSVNIRLAPFQDAGLLHIYPMNAEASNAEELLIRIKTLIEGYAPHAVVVDPLSAWMRAGGQQAVRSVAERLISVTKQRGVTLLTTSLTSAEAREFPAYEATQVRISTIADAWIHLSYLVTAGERNRTLTIIKARGIGHSNQVRELALSHGGVTLTDVYTAGGAVLVGTLRAEREAQERIEREHARTEAARRRRELEAAKTETTARIGALERELAARQAELEQFEQEQRTRDEIVEARKRAVRALRQVDVEEQNVTRQPLAEPGCKEGDAP